MTAGERAAHEVWNERLAPDDFDRELALVLAEAAELERWRELITWFCGRYPTASERLAYARRKHADWTRKPAG